MRGERKNWLPRNWKFIFLSSFVDRLLDVRRLLLLLLGVEGGDNVGSDSPVFSLVPNEVFGGIVNGAASAREDPDRFAALEDESFGKAEDHFGRVVDLSLDHPSVKILVLAFVGVLEDNVFAIR